MSIKRAEPRRALDETRREASRAKCARELLQAPLDSDAGEDHEMSEDASKLHACLLLLEPEKRAAIVQAYCSTTHTARKDELIQTLWVAR